MNDDLGEILLSIQKTQSNILSRLSALEKLQQVSGTNELTVPGGWGYASPTSPPSKLLQIHGGIATALDDNYEQSYISAWPSVDRTIPVSAFSDAYYYRAIIPYFDLRYIGGPFSILYTWEDWTDVATYEECAQRLALLMYELDVQIPDFTYSGKAPYTLCGLAVRNDGTTGSTNKYLPITFSDREQTSFIHRDLRPWQVVTFWT